MGNSKSIQEALNKINERLKNVFALNNYEKNTIETQKTLEKIDNSLEKMSTSFEVMSSKLDTSTNEIIIIQKDLEKVKSGLQKELFESLRNYKTKLVRKGWASVEEKNEAKTYYDEIHNLGADGWSDNYYNQIMSLPEEKIQAYTQH